MLFCDGLLRAAIFLLEWNFFSIESSGARNLSLWLSCGGGNISFQE